MSQITLIAAVGRRGQLGLNGDMPWGRGHPEDLKRFREKTTGGIVIVGHNTWRWVAHLDGTHGRIFLEDNLRWTPFELAERLARRFDNPNIWIAGGAKTYARWMTRCTAFDITRLPYDGPADVWMPPIEWNQA